MRSIESISIPATELIAMGILQRRIEQIYPVRRYILYGSITRGDGDAESDTDLLILTESALAHHERLDISDIISEVNQEYETNISGIVIDAESWEHGAASVLPFHAEVEREGILL